MFDALNDEHTVIEYDLFESWKIYLKKHVRECHCCREYNQVTPYYDIILDITCEDFKFNLPYSIRSSVRTDLGTEYYVNFLKDRPINEDPIYVCLSIRDDRKVKYREYCQGKHHYISGGPSRITYDSDGVPRKFLFHVPNRKQVSFWEYYEESSPDVKYELIKKWLPYV